MFLQGPLQPDHRCRTCRLVKAVCVCSIAPHLDLATRVVVVMHSREWKKASNTGHFAQLALNNAEIRLQGLPHEPLRTDGIDATAPETLVLFPGYGARTLDSDFVSSLTKPATLLIPDGNWQQAKNMMRRVPLLRQARPVALPGPAMDINRPRRNAFPDRMSTFEALAQALGVLEGLETEETLLDFFRRVADRMMMLRGKLKASEVHGGISRETTP